MKSEIPLLSLVSAVLFLAAVFPAASAQDDAGDTVPQAAPAARPEVNVSMKLDIVAWGDTLAGLRIKSGSKEIPFTALAFEYSKPVSYTGSSVLEILGKPAEAGGAAAPSAAATELEKRRAKNPEIVGLAMLPPGSRRATLLIAPGANGTYQSYVIDDDPTKLPTGKLRIHSFCPMPIAIRCNGGNSNELKNRDTTTVAPVDGNVVYELAYQKEGKWKMQENNVILVEPTEQAQLVVLRSDASYFASTDGSRGGFLQTVVLRRSRAALAEADAEAAAPPR